jgi:2-keto-4-pentenoate hydratase/2-oxohepta-3-ene-1,7-dioic acid hydratase in catechol pathway
MKIVRFRHQTEKSAYGILEGRVIEELAQEPYSAIVRSGRTFSLDNIRILPPSEPSKIVLVGLNYKAHAKELGFSYSNSDPIIFLKPPSSLAATNDAIVYPEGVERLDYEAELAVVIKRVCKNTDEKTALDHALGFTCLNDITARDIQKKEGQWTRAKSYDGFCPVGPWIETELDPSRVPIKLYLNGELKQDSNTDDLIFSVPKVIAFISRVMTLYPGDIISTGTPAGVGPMKVSDKVAVIIEGIGALENIIS